MSPPEIFKKNQTWNGEMQFRAIKMSTKDFSMEKENGKRKINCVPENKIILSTAGDNGNFISARILLQININEILIAYFS